MTLAGGDRTRIVSSVGSTGHYLGMRDRSLVELVPCDCLTLNYSAHELVRVPRDPPNFVSADAGGQQALFVEGHDLYRWSRGEQKATLVRGGVVAAAWIPDAPKHPAAPGSIVAVRTGAIDPGPTVVLDPTTGLERSPQLHNNEAVTFVSANANGSEIVFSPPSPTDCAHAGGGPGIQRRSILDGPVTRVVGGSFAPVVSSRNLVAYGIVCDGAELGFTDLTTGGNFRSDPLGDRDRGTSREISKIEPLGWSPDGTRLLYRLMLRGDATQHYYVGALYPAVPSKRTKVVKLADSRKVIFATFIDNQRVLIATTKRGRREMRVWSIAARGTRPSIGGPRAGHMTSLVADHSGLHILAVVDGRLMWWNRGDATVHVVADHIAAAAWLGR